MPNFVIPFKSPTENGVGGKLIPNSQETISLTEDSSYTQIEFKKTANSMDEFTGNKKPKEADITSQNHIEALEPTESASQPKESTIPIPKKVKKEKVKAEKSVKRTKSSAIKTENNKGKSSGEKKKPSYKQEVVKAKIMNSKKSDKMKSKIPQMAKAIAPEEMTEGTANSPILNFNNNQNEKKDTLTGSQRSVYSEAFMKIALSQPGRRLSQKEKLLWLQNRREVGIWVECCNGDCKKWRFLANVFDPLEVPEKWYCQMNPDTSANSCRLKEWALKVEEEEDLIHATYSAGSLVWAHIQGYPWWPALVDDCPDTEQFYWLNGFSDIPTFYNVTFFDEKEVTRSWLETSELYPYVRSGVKSKSKSLLVPKDLRRRLSIATKQADDAMLLGPAQRLKKYSFIARYRGTINHPISKAFLKLGCNQDESFGSDSTDIQTSDNDDDIQPETKKMKVTPQVTNKRQHKGKNQPIDSYSPTVINASPSNKAIGKNIKTVTSVSKPVESAINEIDLNQEGSNKADSIDSTQCSTVDTIDISGFFFTEDSIVPSTQTDLEEINFDNSPTYSKGSPDFEI